MNVFVLCTGRTGSLTLSKACEYITNYTVGHESRCREIGDSRFGYPDNHIEIDNRLAFHLGSLDKVYGNNAKYIHLKRDRNKTALSFSKKISGDSISIMYAYINHIKYPVGYEDEYEKRVKEIQLSYEFIDNQNSNIELFLKGKKFIDIHVENFERDFKKFWNFIDAEGNLEGAINELNNRYNESKNCSAGVNKSLEVNENFEAENKFEKILNGKINIRSIIKKYF